MARFRTFPRGSLLRLHLVDDSTCEGVLVRATRRHFVLERGRVEAAGVLVALKAEHLIVPVAKVKLVEASRQ